MRSRTPQVIERADPGAAVEIMRLRDRATAAEEQARRAQRATAEAREAVGRESAINQAKCFLYVGAPQLFVCDLTRFESVPMD